METTPDALNPGFAADEQFALRLDASDALAGLRHRFEVPGSDAVPPRIYLLGNSLGPPARDVRGAIQAELEAWSTRGVEGYFEAPASWRDLDVRHRDAMSRIVGARPGEVGVMNGLTVNLHLLLASFYRPAGRRTKLLIERPCFPSDRYVATTQILWHGLDPTETLLEAGGGRHGPVTDGSIERVLAESGDEIALVLLGGVNYLTGELLDVRRLTREAHAAGCVVGFDLAHAAGNVPLQLHDWGVDFAAWCTYKYLNSGPGGPGAIFVHEKHGADPGCFRLGGWWGNDPDERFGWLDVDEFRPRTGAAGWQLSCPPVMGFAPLGPALKLFDEAGIERIRDKSLRLTGYLEWLLREWAGDTLRLITPSDPGRRGAQLSLLVNDAAAIQRFLSTAGVDVDVREPDVVRLAPAPLFNSFHETWRAARAVSDALRADG